MHPLAFASGVHEPGGAQVREMPRRLRLRDAERVVQIAHADLARQQQVEDAQPRRVGERLEETLQLGKRLIPHRHGYSP